MEKGIASLFIDGADPGCDYWIAGDGEGQAINNHATKLLTLHVHALPERRGREEHSIGSEAEFLKQHAFGCVALQEHGEFQFSQEALVNVVHLGIAGEQDKSTPTRNFQQSSDAFCGAGRELGRARVGEIRGDVQHRLAGVVKMRGQHLLAGVLQT